MKRSRISRIRLEVLGVDPSRIVQKSAETTSNRKKTLVWGHSHHKWTCSLWASLMSIWFHFDQFPVGARTRVQSITGKPRRLCKKKVQYKILRSPSKVLFSALGLWPPQPTHWMEFHDVMLWRTKQECQHTIPELFGSKKQTAALESCTSSVQRG